MEWCITRVKLLMKLFLYLKKHRLLSLSLIAGLLLSCSYAPPAIDGAMMLVDSKKSGNGFWVSNHGVRVTSPSQPLNDIDSTVVDTSYVGTRITPYSAIAYLGKYVGGGLNVSNTNTMVFASFYIPHIFSIDSTNILYKAP